MEPENLALNGGWRRYFSHLIAQLLNPEDV
jgi:hypothetical protein